MPAMCFMGGGKKLGATLPWRRTGESWLGKQQTSVQKKIM